jgi:hypothetical protein
LKIYLEPTNKQKQIQFFLSLLGVYTLSVPMKRKFDEIAEVKQQPERRIIKRPKLRPTIVPTLYERVMENEDLMGIIGGFLASQDKTKYIQLARINMLYGLWTHPSKYNLAACIAVCFKGSEFPPKTPITCHIFYKCCTEHEVTYFRYKPSPESDRSDEWVIAAPNKRIQQQIHLDVATKTINLPMVPLRMSFTKDPVSFDNLSSRVLQTAREYKGTQWSDNPQFISVFRQWVKNGKRVALTYADGGQKTEYSLDFEEEQVQLGLKYESRVK